MYTVAKQKTIYQQGKLYTDKVIPRPTSMSSETIRDSQLQMLLAVCTPLITNEAQIGLVLRILCGLGIDEIADAFLAS